MSRSIAIRTREPETWTAPETWDCCFKEGPQLKIKPLKMLEPRFQSDPENGWRYQESDKWPIPPELAHLRSSVRQMEAASPKILLERLKEEWIGIADESVCRELDSEKQLWMLTALRRFFGKPSGKISDASVPGITKTLSLYENQGKNQPNPSRQTC
jgi:hypothetical protein